MPSIYGALELNKNELRQAQVQNLASAPSTPVKGQLWFDSTNNILKWYDGTQWVSAMGGAGAVPGDTVSTQAIGDAAAGGASTLYSRADHKHAMPAFGAATADTAFGSAKADGVAVTLARADHIHGNPTHDAAAHSAIPLSALAVPTGAVSLNSQLLTNLATPVSGTDGANKNYVDTTAQGLDAKASVHAASIANIANLATGAPNTLDGITLVANDRVLVKDQTTQSANGIYTVTTLGTGANGVWARATDMDTWAEVPSAYVWVEQGTTQADTGWVVTADQGGTLGTTSITWTMFSSAGALIAGAGLTKTGNTIDVAPLSTGGIQASADTLQILLQTFSGLFTNASGLAVSPKLNGGIGVDATGVYVDPTLSSSGSGSVSHGVSKYVQTLTGTASPETITHNLNTRDISLTVLNGASPYTAVEVDWDATTVNSAVIRYSPSLGAGYRIVIVG